MNTETEQKRAPIFGYLIISLLLICCIVVAGLGVMRLQAVEQQMAQIQGGVQHVQQSAEQQIASFGQTLQQQMELAQQQQTTHQQLEDQLSEMQEQLQYVTKGWHIAQQPSTGYDIFQDVGYRIRLAKMQLTVLKNADTAEVLLEDSVNLLSSLDTPKAMHLKQALLKEVDLLRNLPRINVQDVHAKLDHIAQWLSELDVVEEVVSEASITSRPSAENWKEALEHTWHDFSQLITIKKKTDAGTERSELLAVSTQVELTACLTQIRWAVAYQHADIYQHNLARMQALLSKQYETPNALVASIQDTLSMLSTVELNVALPNLHDALLALKMIEGKAQ